MELLEAIKFVLQRNKKPMHFKEISKIIASEKLIELKGAQTLETIINARIALEVRKAEKTRQHQTFIKLNNGLVGLTNYEPPKPPEPVIVVEQQPAETVEKPAVKLDLTDEFGAINELIAANYKKIKVQLIEKLQKINFLVFERVLENLFREFNFVKYTIVNRRTDGGIDYALNFNAFENNINMLLVVRRWPPARKITTKMIDEIVTTMATHKFNMGAIVLFSDYDTEVREYIKVNSPAPIMLLTIDHLCDLLIKHGIGVHKSSFDLIKINDGYIEAVEDEINQKIEKHRKSSGTTPPAPQASHHTGGQHGGKNVRDGQHKKKYTRPHDGRGHDKQHDKKHEGRPHENKNHEKPQENKGHHHPEANENE